jgi:histidine kinase
MRRSRSLSFRLFLSYLAVVAVATAALFGTARLLGPELFDRQVQQLGQRYGWNGGGGGPGGRGPGAGQAAIEEELNDAFSGSLTVALGVALGAGAVAALAGAALVSRRILRPIDRVSAAVRRMASGRYGEPVPEPPVDELAGLASDVNALGAALADSERRRARLVADLAHEMRTPITSLDGFVEGLEDGVFDASPETLDAMRAETRRLQRLATDLGAVSRADEGAFDLRPQPGDLGEIAAAAARGLAAGIAAAGVEVEVGPLPPLPTETDPDRMGQVFANLLRNALQHTPAGGRITVTGERRGPRVSVAVSDTGSGIAPEHLPHLFERFYRAGEGAAGGTGVGLTIAAGIVGAHGGEITADSPGTGKGATFTVTLPAAG